MDSHIDTTSLATHEVQGFKKQPKSAAVFFSQIIIIYIVVITSIINLSVQDCTKPGVCNLWIVMLSSAMGYLLPNPSMRIHKGNALENSSVTGFDVTDSKPGQAYMNGTNNPDGTVDEKSGRSEETTIPPTSV